MFGDYALICATTMLCGVACGAIMLMVLDGPRNMLWIEMSKLGALLATALLFAFFGAMIGLLMYPFALVAGRPVLHDGRVSAA